MRLRACLPGAGWTALVLMGFGTGVAIAYVADSPVQSQLAAAPKAPLPGELGKRIYESVSKEAWQAWLKHQTMLINENRLNMADPRARQYLMKQTEKFFFGEGADQAAGYVPPTQG